MDGEVWVLGGSGRSGRAVAGQLATRGMSAVLVGRDAARLTDVAATVGAARTVVADSLSAMAEQIRRQRPAVVINTVGPFASTAALVAPACLPSSHYVDLGNDLVSVPVVLGLHEQAVAAGRTLVTGAGFGVTAAESIVTRLCRDRPTPVSVRVDMVPSLEITAGPFGEALAATLLDGLPGVEGGGRYQGRRYAGGRLVAARLGGSPAHLRLPDGSTVTTVSTPLGELIAAQRASGAPSVVSASSEVPSGRVVRSALPLAARLVGIAPLRRLLTRRLARVQLSARQAPRPHSWARAVLTWADGTSVEGWLRAGEAQAFTGMVPAEIARRLIAGERPPGAGTPIALFGTSLAEACGGEFVLGPEAANGEG